MLINVWSFALLLCAAISFFLLALASFSAIKILIWWKKDSDSELQIELEGRTNLASALVETALFIQILSLILLVMAANEFADMIAGAMCATGTLSANRYGNTALFLKIGGVFLYGFWIVLHKLDMCSEDLPLTRLKFVYLLLLLPLLFSDYHYLIHYLLNLKPDIITSCCGVLLSNEQIRESFLTLPYPRESIVGVFYIVAVTLLLWGTIVNYMFRYLNIRAAWPHLIYALVWIIFFPLSLAAITLFFSSYIYAMPHHNCPFDIIQSEYNFIGVPLYVSLFLGTFLGASGGLAMALHNKGGLARVTVNFQKYCIPISLVFLLIFVGFVTSPMIIYMIAGGEL